MACGHVPESLCDWSVQLILDFCTFHDPRGAQWPRRITTDTMVILSLVKIH
jgi:hypothetical protein